MALSKALFFHLKTLKPPVPLHHLAGLRLISFATPEDATAERRRRKERLGMDPPLASLRHLRPPPPPHHPPPSTPKNPNTPKLPEPASALAGGRLVLHNKILTLIRESDLGEADLLVRHSIYSNCRPTVFTCNAVLAALLRASRHAELLALHRFITQAGIVPTIVTHNLLLQALCDRRHTNTALEHYRVILRDSPLTPSPTTYRILIRGLLDDSRLEDAILIKDDMTAKSSCLPDPVVYDLLMSGLITRDDPDRALALFDELKENLGGKTVLDGIVYGSLMKAYFRKGMEKEAMECYKEAIREGSKVRFKAASYNSVLEALSKNGRFNESLLLFERMTGKHNPPIRLNVDLGSFNIMIDGFSANGRFDEAIANFRNMGDKKCSPDTPSYNNLIGHLGKNCMVAEAEELFSEMGEHGANPDEFTYVLLMEACFGVSRIDDATAYFEKMVELGLKPNTVAYNKVIRGLVNVGRLDQAKEFFDQMVEREVKPDIASYEMLLLAFCESGRSDDALKILKGLLMDEGVVLRPETKDVVDVMLRKEGREEELGKLFVEVEREKAEALARAAEEKARAEALAREEAQRRKAEAAEKEAAAARASAAAIEAILGRRNLSVSNEEKKEDSLAVGASGSYQGVLKEVINGNSSVEEPTVGDEDAAHWGSLKVGIGSGSD